MQSKANRYMFEGKCWTKSVILHLRKIEQLEKTRFHVMV